MTVKDVSVLPNNNSLNFKNKLVSLWSCKDVQDWLNYLGFYEWSDYIAIKHKINGKMLLTLSEIDLRLPPLSISCLGDLKRLSNELSKLQSRSKFKNQNFFENTNNTILSEEKLISTSIVDGNCLQSKKIIRKKKINNDIHVLQFMSRDELIKRVESPDTDRKSLVKCVLAFVYCSISLLTTSFVMVLVHDRVPNMKMYLPLPDLVLDNIPLIPWAFECCEILGITMSIIWITILIFHKHRIVIMRRMFSITGTIFLLRCFTMLITSLSVPGIHLKCRAVSYGNLKDKFKQAFYIWSRLGMSIQGVRTCGDYMFSGHTATITLLNHFITEYTPDEWRGLHTMMWIMNAFGIFFILAGHEHYSIDVFIAFYITSRMFLSYHANAYNYANMITMDSRVRVWFPLGWFFESGVVGRIENVFEFPKFLPKIILNKNNNNISKIADTNKLPKKNIINFSTSDINNNVQKRRKVKK